MSKKIIKIELQHFEGCPNGPTLIENVNEAIKDLKEFVDYKEILVDNYELAKKIGFRGSPTLLIDGKDFENMPIPFNPGMNCRLYPNGVPKPQDIKNKILELLAT